MPLDCSRDFGPFDGRVWINAAHQGALPRIAAERAEEAVRWKRQPFELTTERFSGVPQRLRHALATLTGADAEDIVLANSASYGLHLMANGMPLRDGDEVLLMKGDFPSDILPWLGLEKRGVKVRFIEPRQVVVQPDELERHITPATKVFCTTWVHSFSGWAVDMEALGEVCRRHGVWFVLNGSQATGTRPLDLATAPVDAFTSVGFKWLCGPYGTGFLWIRPELRDALEYNQAYWLSMQTADDLGSGDDMPRIKTGLKARQYDVFGTANFFNYVPWTAAIEYLTGQGIENIRDHDQALVSRFIAGLDERGYELFSPRDGRQRSTLVLFSHREPDRNQSIWGRLRANGIFTSYRKGKLRAAPHLYNTGADIDELLDGLEQLG
jgi:selenocysteine lyase/cysteine desulfurase